MHVHKIIIILLALIILLNIFAPVTAIATVSNRKPIIQEQEKHPLQPIIKQPLLHQGVIAVRRAGNRIQGVIVQSPNTVKQENLKLIQQIDPNLFNTEFVKKTYGDKLRVFVKYKDNKSLDTLKQVVEKLGGRIAYKYPIINTVLVIIPMDKREAFIQEASDLIKKAMVEAVTLDYPQKPALDTSTQLIGAQTAWNLGYNGSGVIVGVLDTGIDPSHPDFYFPNGTSKILANVSFVDYNFDGVPDMDVLDNVGHGTHVASTIAGTGRAEVYAHSGEYAWHSVTRWMPFGNAFGNPNGWENILVYWFNVTGHDNVTLSFWDSLHINPLWYYAYGYDDEALVLYSYDGSNWTVLDTFNITTRDTTNSSWMHHEYTINTTGHTQLYIMFAYVAYIAIEQTGWWIDDISIPELNFTDNLESGRPTYIPGVGGHVYDDNGWFVVRGRFTGVAPGAKLLIGRVCDTSSCWTSWIMNGMIWAAIYGADGVPLSGDEANVISMSLGGPASYYDPEAQLIDALTKYFGVTFVVAAGNNGDNGPYTVESPGIAFSAITVAAAQKPVDNLPIDIVYFSSRGPTITNLTIKPDVAAPGVAIIAALSKYWGYSSYWDLDPYYTIMSGTSMATPHVSGAVAVIKSAHPDWNTWMIKSALMSTATWLDYRRYSSWYPPTPATVYEQGGGFINVTAAIKAQALPINASLSFQVVKIGSSKTLSFLVKILNSNITSLSIINDTVRYIEYAKYGSDYYVANITPYTGWLSYNITQVNSTLYNVSVTLSVPSNATGGLYDGIIWLNASGYVFHVVLGFIASPIKLIGRAIDFVNGTALPNVTVLVVNTSYDIYSWDITNSSGYFEVTVPADEPVFLYAYDQNNNYYIYYGRFMLFLPPFAELDPYMLYMTPRWGYADRHVLVVADDFYGYYYPPDLSIFLSFNNSYGFIMREWYESLQGIPVDPILWSNDFPFVIWSSCTSWYAVVPPDDYILQVFTQNYTGKLLIEGEDIGWFHKAVLNDTFLEDVLHAVWLADSSGVYNITPVAIGHLLTANLSGNISIGHVPWPDAIAPYNGSQAAFNYSGTSMSAIIYYYNKDNISAEGKLVYAAFPLVNVTTTERQQIIKNSLLWLLLLAETRINATQTTPAGDYKLNGTITSGVLGLYTVAYKLSTAKPIVKIAEPMIITPGTTLPFNFEAKKPWWVANPVTAEIEVYYNGWLLFSFPVQT